MSSNGLSETLGVVANALREVGEELTPFFGKIEKVNHKSADGLSPVTEMDIRAEEFIVKQLSAHDASIGFHGEELGQSGSKERFWLIDPIDGTSHFIRGIPFCTSMVALVDNDEVVLSAIYNFITKELFLAEKGAGATLNGEPIHVNSRGPHGAYLSFETDLRDPKDEEPYLAFCKKYTIVHTINCGYEFGLVASGKLDGRISLHPYGSDWDFAPGALLVKEAGGIVRNFGSSGYDFTNHNFIATNQILFKELMNEKNELIIPTR